MSIEIRVELILMYAFSVRCVQLNDLIRISSCLSISDGMNRRRKTYTTGLRNLEDCYTIAICPLHLHVQLLMPHDEDYVDCNRRFSVRAALSLSVHSLWNASTHALIMVSRWSLPVPEPAAKDDGVSTVKPAQRPRNVQRSQIPSPHCENIMTNLPHRSRTCLGYSLQDSG